MRSYIIQGQLNKNDIGECNIVDKWNGQFKFHLALQLPCQCWIYVGDLQIAQENNWPEFISVEDDFPFELRCQCGGEIFQSLSASSVQDHSGWAYVFSN